MLHIEKQLKGSGIEDTKRIEMKSIWAYLKDLIPIRQD